MALSDLEKTKKHLIGLVSNQKSDPFGLIEHITLVERWANFILKHHPEADKKIVLLGVWLHDIGHYPLDDQDHAVRGEKIALDFMKQLNLKKDEINKVAHCVRAHRCKDVMPKTVEAKIVACADSASHLTDYAYLDLILKAKESKNLYKYKALEKLERDYRDLALFPEIKNS